MKFCIVGTGRCGTNLLHRLLNLHPELFVFNESHWIPKMFEFFGTGVAQSDELLSIVQRTEHVTGKPVLNFDVEGFRSALSLKPTSTVREFCEQLGSFVAAQEGKRSWADKTPDYGPYMSVLQTLWPECKFVHLIRHGAEVSLSMSAHPGFRWMVASRERWWITPSFNSYYRAHEIVDRPFGDFVELWYSRLERIRNESLRLASGSYTELRFEELMADPMQTLSALAQYLELEISDSWLEATAQIVEPGRVKCHAAQVPREAFLPHHNALLSSLGYE